jgi:REP element-mobilizing transposase RayT
MRRPEIAELVAASIRYGSMFLGHYELLSYCVMPNHAHVLVVPKVEPARLLHSIKGYTAREANRLLARSGQPFWQAESFDRWVRNAQELERIRTYIENNPVSAGLVVQPEEYRWSSACQTAG